MGAQWRNAGNGHKKICRRAFPQGLQLGGADQEFRDQSRARHAIAYHFFNEDGTRYGIYQGVRETYSGPMSLAVDNMVWNITKDKITERMTVSPDQAWSVPGPKPSPSPVTGVAGPLNEAMKDGKGDVSDAQDAMINSFKQEHDLK